MSGLESSAGTDLDSLLEGRVTSKISNINLQDSSGSDITNRYEKASSGTTHSGSSGLESSGGTDVFDLFARQGSANFAVLSGNAFTNSATQNRRTVSGEDSANTSLYLQVNSGGSIIVSGLSATASNWDGGSSAVAVAPRNTYEVRFVTSVNSSNGVTITNGASSWSNLSSNRRVTLAFSSSAIGTWTRTFTVTVEIRRVGFTTPIVSNTFNCSIQLQIEAGWNANLSGFPTSISHVVISNNPSVGAVARSAVFLRSDGTIAEERGVSNFIELGRWDGNDATTRNNTEVRFVPVSGTINFGTLNSWDDVASLSRAGNNILSGTFAVAEGTVRIELRNKNNTSQIVTRNVPCRAERRFG